MPVNFETIKARNEANTNNLTQPGAMMLASGFIGGRVILSLLKTM